MDRGTTISFTLDQVNYNEDEASEELVLNVLGGNDELVRYCKDVLEATGFRHVGNHRRQLEVWETPGYNRAFEIYFLFREGLPHPVASSVSEESVKHLKDSLEFVENGQLEYEIKSRTAPTAS
jgi:hypothetical protein